ncbi:MAG: PDC sensor domain-containing protein [Gammaproteobacteria bacterium]|nr:PDC sensor domain-containing protein [Gammaproteobacteria bacterium]
MSSMSYLSVIERYHEYRSAIHELMGSIVTGALEAQIFQQVERQRQVIKNLRQQYPFVDLLYVLDGNGIQISENIASERLHSPSGKGCDRSQRSYYQLAIHSSDVVVTEPYLSSASGALCISAALRRGEGSEQRVLVIDIDLAEIVEFLMGDTARRRFQPLFKWVYATIAVVLFFVAALLLYFGVEKFWMLLLSDDDSGHASSLMPFSVVIFATLALAIFDLGKTIFEEEVLMHKDIYRHSSTRRTITRFIAAILIAVSIEALMVLFKSVLGDGEHLIHAAWLLACSVGLLVGLGIYVYLGARAEAVLLAAKR